MLRFNDDYFTFENDEYCSSEIYYWDDVIRIAYYVHRERSYYYPSDDEVYLVVEHECGDYLRIPYGTSDCEIFEKNMEKYLTSIEPHRKKLLEDAPLEKLINIYVRQ